MSKKSMPAPKRASSPVKDVFKPYRASMEAPPYYEIEFTYPERRLVYEAIEEKTGLNYVDSLMSQSMNAFGRAHGVPYCYTHCDDALVYCCIQLGIDYRVFPHNTPKLPIDGFYQMAKLAFPSWSAAANDIERSVQQTILGKLWRTWIEEDCNSRGCARHEHTMCSEFYDSPDFGAIARTLTTNNQSRKRLLTSIDARPSKSAVKIANDALARISVGAK